LAFFKSAFNFSFSAFLGEAGAGLGDAALCAVEAVVFCKSKNELFLYFNSAFNFSTSAIFSFKAGP